MASILDRTDELIDDWLGLEFQAQGALYKCKQAWIDCSEMQPSGGCDFVRSFIQAVDENCRNRTRPQDPSKQNWRFEPRPNIAPHNRSVEKRLEKNLVRGAPSSLANQIPVASGVCSDDEGKRAIDLAQRRRPNEYTFFELKVPSNKSNPVHAAMELLGYGACYVAARLNMSQPCYERAWYGKKELLAATVVHLRVLAPLEFYLDGGRCRSLLGLQTAIDSGLWCVKDFVGSLRMDFAFEAFPEDFAASSDPAVLRDCLCRRVPAYPPAAP